MSKPVAVLVVCEGNLCRSPMAERLLRLRTKESEVVVSSAGVNASAGEPMDELAAQELVRLGADPSGFVSRQLTAEMVAGADLVLTATRDIRSRLVAMSPPALKRSFTLIELASLLEAPPWGEEEDDLHTLLGRAADWRASVSGLGDALDIADPIGRSERVHREVADLVDHATEVIADRLVQAVA